MLFPSLGLLCFSLTLLRGLISWGWLVVFLDGSSQKACWVLPYYLGAVLLKLGDQIQLGEQIVLGVVSS